MSLYHLHRWYLMVDVLMLADLWTWLCQTIENSFSVHPANFLTGNGMAFRAAIQMGREDIEQLADHQQQLLFRKLLRGGYVGLTRRYASANNVELPNYDRDRDDTFIISLDWNSLYPTLLEKNCQLETSRRTPIHTSFRKMWS